MIVAKNLIINRNGLTLFENLSFQLARGKMLVITGKNGVGKSTLLKTLVGLLPLKINGGELKGCENFHYLGHKNAMKAVLSVEENLMFYGGNKKTIHKVLAKLQIENLRYRLFGNLSVGQARKVALAKLFLQKKPLWILDEPMAGLDMQGKKQFMLFMAQYLKAKGMIILAQHESFIFKNSIKLNLDRL